MKLKNKGPHAIFFDVDGTLIPYLSSGEVSERTKNAIVRLRKDGHAVFINSGRAEGYLSKVTVNSAPFDGIVCGLGAYIQYHGDVIYHRPISRDTIGKIADYCREHGETCIFEGVSDGTDGRYSIGESGFFEVGNCFEDKESLLCAIGDTLITKISVVGVPNPEYAAFLEGFFDMVYIPSHNYSEGAVHGNNKGTGILKVCEFLGIPPENTVAVGDSINDTKMLETAAIAVAMGNATDDIKELCDIVTDTVDNDGAAKIIEELFF